jgi:hypothetical protein
MRTPCAPSCTCSSQKEDACSSSCCLTHCIICHKPYDTRWTKLNSLSWTQNQQPMSVSGRRCRSGACHSISNSGSGIVFRNSVYTIHHMLFRRSGSGMVVQAALTSEYYRYRAISLSGLLDHWSKFMKDQGLHSPCMINARYSY